MPEDHNMKTYIGTNIVCAEPMTAGRFIETHHNGRVSTNDVDAEGYLVVYSDEEGSWSPKGVFEAVYQLILDDEGKMV